MGHFYAKDGTPHFDLAPAKAKELGLYFSVTEIQKCEANPGLDRWKLNTAIDTSVKNPMTAHEKIEDYRRRIINAMYADNSATQLGTDIHDAIEHILDGSRTIDHVSQDLLPYVKPAIEYFQEKEFEVVALEKIVVNVDEGYAGTADCIAKSGDLDFILDWKSTKTIPSKPYDSHPEQVSAYAVAYFGEDRVMNGEIWGANAYISTSAKDKKTGLAKFRVHSYEPSVLAEAYKRFKIVNNLWRMRNKYDPRKFPGNN